MAELKIDNGDWVVVCDGAKALVLENAGTRTHLNLMTKEVYEQPDPKTSEMGTDKPGRTFNSMGGGGRGAIEQTDWHDQEEQKLPHQAGGPPRQGSARRRDESLIVVAPPRAIGMLRREFSTHVRHALKAEVEKDYVKMPVEEIAKHLVA